ncbi:OmpA family protein [Thermodesulfobacteriota bacterium]
MTNESSDTGQGQDSAKVIPLQRDEFAELRRLLLSAEQSQIREMLERLNDPKIRAEEVGRILSEAILHRAKEDKTLIPALMPAVEEILKASVKKDPRTLADSLFPVMGPAIRRSIAEFLRETLQSMNRAMEHSFTLKGLKWRFESFRTGKSFADVVLHHSLAFSVEQVFLIHQESGLLLLHVSSESAVFEDADMVSGMLTAIQDFVRDSFRAGQSDELDNLKMGELTVIVEQGPLAYVAAVIRGTPPEELRTMFKETLEAIHLRLGDALETYDGDAGPFQSATSSLEACLQNRFKTEERKSFPYVLVITLVFGLGLAYWIVSDMVAGSRRQNYIDKLRGEKGIVIVSAQKEGGKFRIYGLRDSRAVEPSRLVDGTGLKPDEVSGQWEGFQALEPEYVLARARSLLKPPQDVTLTLEDGVLSARGKAPIDWVKNARSVGPSIPGVKEYRDAELSADYGRVLHRVKEVIAPPETVKIDLNDGVLTLKGSAPRNWIENSRRLVHLFPEIREYRSDQLKVDYDLVFQRIKRALDAPESVTLSFLQGTLTATGTAPYQWIGQSRKLVRLFPEIKEYRDNRLKVDYSLILERIEKVLAPPKTVTLNIAEGILSASGEASHRWINEARKTVRGFPEISGYRDKDLTDLDEMRFNALSTEIDRISLYFRRNNEQLSPNQEKVIEGLVSRLRELKKLSQELGKTFSVEIKGHADASGLERDNLALSMKRAATAVDLISAGGIDRSIFVIKGAGSAVPLAPNTSEDQRALNRRVNLLVVVKDPSTGRGRR